jgi:hypothetical protein
VMGDPKKEPGHDRQPRAGCRALHSGP